MSPNKLRLMIKWPLWRIQQVLKGGLTKVLLKFFQKHWKRGHTDKSHAMCQHPYTIKIKQLCWEEKNVD